MVTQFNNRALRKLRNKAGLTQEGLAQAADSSQQEIYRYESGARVPGIVKAADMVKALRAAGVTCSLDDLVKWGRSTVP
jgi:transcriptional regulator with XRE-family HTH domain